MNASNRWLRFGAAVGMAIILVGWAIRTSWRELRQLRESFAVVESESFHASDYVEAPLRLLNEALLEHDLRGDRQSRIRFEREGADLQEWIDSHASSVQTAPERAIMRQLQGAVQKYRDEGARFMDLPKNKLPKPFLQLVQENAAPVLQLCDNLAAAERDGLHQFMKASNRSLLWLEGLLVFSLALLLLTLTVVGLSGYRELLAPLRTQLRQSRAMVERQEKLASLGTLAAGVAHEIRNPLTAINVRVHSLKRNLVPGSSEQEDAVVIDGEIKRLEAIVQSFLQFARPAAPRFVTVSADSLLARVRALLAGQLEKSGIELGLDAPPDIWVRVDPAQIEQVLINLVRNAAESIEHDGAIQLRARKTNARMGGKTRPAAVLEVSDTGKGIPPEVQKRLFDPFFTTKETGTGLGLSIAMRIVEQQGGLLQYTTQLERGTTFRLLLPEAEPLADDHPPSNTTH